MPTPIMYTLHPRQFRGTCIFLWCLGGILLIPLSHSMGMAPPEEEIETLDTIEITGEVIEQQERMLKFPIPQIGLVDHPDTRQNLPLPKLRLHKPIPAPSPVILDQTAKTGNLHTPVKPLKTERPPLPSTGSGTRLARTRHRPLESFREWDGRIWHHSSKFRA